ncbi:hypothetical protein T484DRAFT_1961509 [Baffinella frigidus]|nr:hypothetical protein T484DRAFT_1961509 [Cryptophyta sp. CCMP2293]
MEVMKVETVKGMMAELFREKNELVQRLNGMQQRIELEKDPAKRVLRHAAWMEEKERTVKRLNTRVASLQGLLEADGKSGELAPAARTAGTGAMDELRWEQGGLCRDDAHVEPPTPTDQPASDTEPDMYLSMSALPDVDTTATTCSEASTTSSSPFLSARRPSFRVAAVPTSFDQPILARRNSEPLGIPQAMRKSLARTIHRISVRVLGTMFWNPSKVEKGDARQGWDVGL